MLKPPHLVVLLLLGLPLAAQTVWQVPLPAGIPAADLDQDVFFTREALCFTAGGGIHTLTGLPAAPIHQVLMPAGPATMCPGQGWYPLGEDVALYRAVGTDLLPGTADDLLVLVHGLPASPTLEVTTLTGLDADFVPVNPTTAVRVESGPFSSFAVLRHGGTPALELVACQPLTADTAFVPGRVSNDAFAAWGPGADGTLGTGDDRIVVLSGLGGPVAFVSETSLPAGSTPQGFFLTEGGVGIWWNDPSQGYQFGYVRDLGTAPGMSARLVVPPACSTSPAPGLEVVRAPGDAVVARTWDNSSFGWANTHLRDDSGIFLWDGTWCDQGLGGDFGRLIAPGRLLRQSMAFPSPWLSLWALGENPPVSTAFNLPGSNIVHGAVMPNDDSLVVTAVTYPSTSWLHVLVDVWGSRTTSTELLAGFWVGPLVALGRGRVAGFLAGASGASDLQAVCVVSVPTAAVVAEASIYQYSPEVFTQVLPTVPWAGAPLRIQAWVEYPVSSPTPALLGLAWEQAPAGIPLLPPFHVVSRLHLDPASVFILLPFDLQQGFAEISFGPLVVPPALSGRDLVMQVAAFHDLEGWLISDCWLIVPE